jgi:hypothetical protein
MNGNGQFVVAWTHSSSSSPSIIQAQTFNSDGTPRGGVTSFSVTNSQNSDPSVGIDTAVDYAIAYTVTSPSGQRSVAGWLVPASGSSVAFSGQTPNGDAAYHPSVAMNGTGTFVVAYTVDEGSGITGIFALPFNSRGVAQGNGPVIPVDGQGVDEASTAVDGAGNFVVAYTYNSSQTAHQAVAVTYWQAGGTGLLGIQLITSQSFSGAQNNEHLDDPCAMVDGSGDLVVAYTAGGSYGIINASDPPPTVMASTFALGNGLSLQQGFIPISTEGITSVSNYDWNPSVDLKNGRLLAAWENYGAAQDGRGDHAASVTPLTNTFTNAPFRISLVGSPTVNLTDGFPTQVQVAIDRNSGFTDPINFTVACPAGVGVSGPGSTTTSPVTFTFDTNASFAYNPNLIYTVTIQANSNGNGAQSIPLTLNITPGHFSSISPTEGFEPVNMQLGTLVTIAGVGFVQGSTVTFGTGGPIATANWVSSDGTLLAVNVPRAAVSGPLSINRPGHSTLTTGSSFTVHSFRDTNAFSFPNYSPEITFQNVSDAFGYDATHVSVDDVTGPVGWLAKQAGIDVTTPSPTPLALAFTAAAEAVLGGHGECFGMDLASQILQHQPQRIFDEFTLNGNGTTVYDLEKTDDLANWIQQLLLYQWSAEMLNYFVNWEASSHDDAGVYSLLQSQLQVGEHPLISLPSVKHAVAAYDLTGTPDDFQIWTYNPNRPYDDVGVDESQYLKHLQAEANDIIHVKNGQWTFISQLNPQEVSGGDFSSLIVVPWGTIPDQPTLPGADSFTTLYQISLGSGGSSSSGGPAPVSISAGGDVTIDAALFAAGSTNTIRISADPVTGVTVTLNGTPTQFSPGTVTSINYYGGAGNDSIDLEQTPAGVPVTLYLATGNDTVDIAASAQTLDGLGADVNVVGGQGTDTMNVYDQANGGATTYTLDGYRLSRSGAGTIHYSWIDNVNIYGGSSADTYNVLSTEKKFTTTLNVPGAGSSVNVQGTVGPLALNVSGSNAAVNVGDASNTLTGIQGALTVNGQGAQTTLNVHDEGTTVSQTYYVYDTSIHRLSANSTTDNIAAIGYHQVGTLLLNQGSAQTGVNLGRVQNETDVFTTAAGTDTTVKGGAGNNGFWAAPYDGGALDDGTGIRGPLHFQGGGSGLNYLNYFDYLDPTPQTYTMTAGQFVDTGFAPVTYDTSIIQAVLYTSAKGGNHVNVLSTSPNWTGVNAEPGDAVTVGSLAPSLGGTLANLAPGGAFMVQDIQGSVSPGVTVTLDDSGDTQMGKQVTFNTDSYAWGISGLAPERIYLPLGGTGSNVQVLGGSPAAGQSGGSTYNIQSTPAGVALSLSAGTGGDAINVGDANNTLSGIQGALTVIAQGKAALSFNDQGAPVAPGQSYDYEFTQNSFHRTGTASVTFSGIATVNLHAANLGSTGGYNVLGVASTAPGTAYQLYAGTGENEFIVEDATNTLNGIQGPLFLHGAGGTLPNDDLLEMEDIDKTARHTFLLTAGATSQSGVVQRFNPVTHVPDMAAIRYDGLDAYSVLYTFGDLGDTINVQSQVADAYTVIEPGTGDTVTVGNTSHTMAGILGDLSIGSPLGQKPTVLLDDSGDTSARTIDLANNPEYGYQISGLLPPSTVGRGYVWLGLDPAAPVTLKTGAGSTATNDVFRVHDLTGAPALKIDAGNGSNTLVGPDQPTTWTISGANSGSLGTLKFAHIQNLVGGSASDLFKFGANGGLSGSINGGGGGDWLDYSGLPATVPVTVNLVTGVASGVAGGVSNIANVCGGQGNNTLTGNGGNILIGGGGTNRLTDLYSGSAPSGRSLLIGGSGSSTLTAGGAGDILIAGTSNLDANYAGLQSLLAEWQSADSYLLRFQRLEGLVTGGLNGTNKLIWGSTVKDNDKPGCVLHGGAGLDWFFANFPGGDDTITNLNNPSTEHLDNNA